MKGSSFQFRLQLDYFTDLPIYFSSVIIILISNLRSASYMLVVYCNINFPSWKKHSFCNVRVDLTVAEVFIRWGMGVEIMTEQSNWKSWDVSRVRCLWSKPVLKMVHVYWRSVSGCVPFHCWKWIVYFQMEENVCKGGD